MPLSLYTPTRDDEPPMTRRESLPVIGFVAKSGTGKTTLLARLVRYLECSGVRTAVIKQARRDFEIDYPGKDSYVLRKAGARQVLVASEIRSALIIESEGTALTSVSSLIEQFDRDTVDIVLVEGYRNESFPKIELARRELSAESISTTDDSVIAVATDAPELVVGEMEVLDINDVSAIAEFIGAYFDIMGREPRPRATQTAV